MSLAVRFPGAKTPSKADQERVAELLSQVADQVASLPEKQVQNVLALVDQAARETKAALDRLAKRFPDASGKYTAHHHRALLLQLEETKRLLTERLPAEMRDELLDGARSIMGPAAMEHLAQEVSMFSEAFGGVPAQVDLDAMSILSRSDNLLLNRFERSVMRYGKGIGSWADTVAKQLAIGRLRGENINQLVARLTRPGDEVAGLSQTLKQVSGDMFRKYRHRAETLVRTELMHAYNTNVESALTELEEDDPGWVRRWDATGDSRLCITCYSLDGKIAEIGELFPGGYERPPAHPRCRCALTPWREEWNENASGTVSGDVPKPDGKEPRKKKPKSGKVITDVRDVKGVFARQVEGGKWQYVAVDKNGAELVLRTSKAKPKEFAHIYDDDVLGRGKGIRGHFSLTNSPDAAEKHLPTFGPDGKPIYGDDGRHVMRRIRSRTVSIRDWSELSEPEPKPKPKFSEKSLLESMKSIEPVDEVGVHVSSAEIVPCL